MLLLVLAALPAAGVAAVAAPVDPDREGRLGIQLLEAPVVSRDDPRALIYIIDALAPGTTIDRRFQVTNVSDSPSDVALYPGAASIADGEFRFADGRAGNDLTGWTTVTPDEQRIPRDGAVDGVIRIAVPADASGGERYGVVWAEVASDPADGQVQQVSRVGIRIYLSVSGEEQTSAFEITSITAQRDDAGAPVVSATMRNTGDRAVDVAGTVGLSEGPGGVSAAPVDTGTTLTLAPGDVGSVQAVFDAALPDGPWLVGVSLTSGTLTVEASATLSFGATAETAPVDTSGSTLWPWLAGLAALAVLVLLVAFVRRRTAVPA